MEAGAAALPGANAGMRTRTYVGVTRDGDMSFLFDVEALEAVGLKLSARKPGLETETAGEVRFAIENSHTMEVEVVEGVFSGVRDGTLRARGALLFGAAGRHYAIGDLTLGVEADGRWVVSNMLGEPGDRHVAFDLSTVLIDLIAADERFRLAGDMAIAEPFAVALGVPEAAGTVVGILHLDAKLAAAAGAEIDAEGINPVRETVGDRGGSAVLIGPDVIVGDLYLPDSYGSVGDISAFAVGTISCNVGDQTLNWFANTNQHPVIAQNMFRLKDGRFEQIGQSWLKHGFFALAFNDCGLGCNNPDTGTLLGVGCSDPYSASLNGSQSSLGAKSEVNAHTGYFPYPRILNPPYDGTIGRRIQVHNSDLDPIENQGAEYFIEGQYVSPDDARARNQNNNASYRRISVSGGGGSFNITTTGSTQRERPAIAAWFSADPGVTPAFVQIPGDGLLIVGAKATDVGGGVWNYEYAVQNLTSDRSVGTFSVPIDVSTIITNIGFHDVDYHSNEVFDGTDWPAAITDSAITWSTEDYNVNPDANALRWGTLYNFRFQADRAPVAAEVTLGLFKPDPTGPSLVVGMVTGPTVFEVDCGACPSLPAPHSEQPFPAEKNRHLSLTPVDAGCRTALRVTINSLPPPYDVLNGTRMWVGQPQLYCENAGQTGPPEGGCGPAPGLASPTFAAATLTCTPHYDNWSVYGTVHVFHKAIVPLGAYSVQALIEGCSPVSEELYSLPLSIFTSAWGDLVENCTVDPCGPPDGSVDVIGDAIAILAKFGNFPGAPIKARADLEPALLDFTINITDVLSCISAFQGGGYPFTEVPPPCGQ